MTIQTIQTTRKRDDDSLMYEEDKDSVILRLRVELAQERAKRKELALVERDWSRERSAESTADLGKVPRPPTRKRDEEETEDDENEHSASTSSSPTSSLRAKITRKAALKKM